MRPSQQLLGFLLTCLSITFRLKRMRLDAFRKLYQPIRERESKCIDREHLTTVICDGAAAAAAVVAAGQDSAVHDNLSDSHQSSSD